jgi:hypothetical protein
VFVPVERAPDQPSNLPAILAVGAQILSAIVTIIVVTEN